MGVKIRDFNNLKKKTSSLDIEIRWGMGIIE